MAAQVDADGQLCDVGAVGEDGDGQGGDGTPQPLGADAQPVGALQQAGLLR